MITADLQQRWAKGLTGEAGQADTDWLELLRRQAAERISELPPLTRKQENWRYTNVEPILKQAFTPVVEAPRDYSGTLPESGASFRLVFVDGWFMPALSRIGELPAGATLSGLHQAIGRDDDVVRQNLNRATGGGEHLFTALNTALINDGLLLHLSAGLILEQPIEVFYLNSASDQSLLVQPRNLVVLDEGASATLVEHFLPGNGSGYLHNNLTEVLLGDASRLDHYRIQDDANDAWHQCRVALDQGHDSHYHGITLAFGGRLSRTEYHSAFSAEGASCILRGLYTVGDDQLTDFHLDMRHSVPRCTSREQFKGLLYGKGRAVFDGRILVDKNAQKSDAQLTNDNLLLTRRAEVDTKPQLEIYADDVKCNHGTTVGQLDNQQIFYLRTRGIEEGMATRMLCLGFAAEIIEQILLPELREQALARLHRTLDTLTRSN